MKPSLRRAVLARVEPSRERTRSAMRLARRLQRRVREEAEARGLRVWPTLVGSLAKDTHLADPLDVDVFILFPPETPREALEKEGLALGHAVLPGGIQRYAEHPYVHGALEGLDVDVVPAYRLRSARGKLSAVDRTPFHTRFVKRRATPAHRADIRLLKAFLRGVRCYGAETATGGVSGYLAELLVLHYGRFERVIDAIATWKPPVHIALEGRAEGLAGTPLVVIDPVDPDRNAAAAVTPATFERLQRAARAFAKAPSDSFFFPPEPKALPPKRLERLLRGRGVLGLRVRGPGDADTLVPQGQRLLAKLGRALAQQGFRYVRGDVFDLGEGRLLLLAEHAPGKLPPRRTHQGPLDRATEHRDRFVAKWRGHPDALSPPRLVDGRWRVEVRQTRRTPQELFGPEFRPLLQGFEFAADEARLLTGRDLAMDPLHADPLTRFLTRREPWEGAATPS